MLALLLLGTVFMLFSSVKASAMSTGAIISLTNQKRAENGLPPLNTNWALMSSASAKANDMFANNYWAHVSPSGLTPWYFMGISGYNYVTAGENLAKDFQTEAAVVDGWMNSAGHRQNILNPSFRDIGVAAQAGTLLGSPTTLVVAHYGATATYSEPAPAPAPEPAPAPAPVETAPTTTEPAPTQSTEPVTTAPDATAPTTEPDQTQAEPSKKQLHKKSNLHKQTTVSKLVGKDSSFIPTLIGLFRTSDAYSFNVALAKTANA